MKQTPNLLKAGLFALVLWAGNANAETELTVSATPAIFKPMFESFVKDFEAANPGIKVSLEVPAGDQEDMIQDLLRKSLIGNVPDVTFQGYNFIRTIADRELAVPLDPFLAKDADWSRDRISANVSASASVNGSVYGLGVAYSFLVVYYNADLTKDALGDKPFPTTWEGLLDLGTKIHEKDAETIGGYIRPDSWVFQALIEGDGGAVADAKTNSPTFAGPEGLRAFELLRKFGQFGQGLTPMSRDQARQAFNAGKVGFVTDASSVLSRLEGEVAGKFNLGVARFPITPEGRIPAAGIAALMLTKDPQRQEAAWHFMKFLVEAQGQLDVVNNTSYVPTNAIAIHQSSELKAALSKQPKMQAAIDTVPFASAWYAFPGANTARIDKEINNTMELVVTSREDPAKALQELKAKVDAFLK